MGYSGIVIGQPVYSTAFVVVDFEQLFTPAFTCSSSRSTMRTPEQTCEICSKQTIKTSERRQWCHSGAFIVDFS